MNLLYATILETFQEEGLRRAKVRVGGAINNVTLEMLADADIGDEVLVCDGIAIARVRSDETPPRENEESLES
jgi:hydrogenase maturation factor